MSMSFEGTWLDGRARIPGGRGKQKPATPLAHLAHDHAEGARVDLRADPGEEKDRTKSNPAVTSRRGRACCARARAGHVPPSGGGSGPGGPRIPRLSPGTNPAQREGTGEPPVVVGWTEPMTSNSVPPPPDASEGAVPKEGDVLAGKYRVERVLGEGGMGIVVAAQHTTLRQRVAIKLLLPEAAKRADSAERFLREARASVSNPERARHPRHGRRAARDRRALHRDGAPPAARISTPTSRRVASSGSRRASITSSRPARRSPRRTPSASSTATSSRRTSSSRSGRTARPSSRCSTSASRS